MAALVMRTTQPPPPPYLAARESVVNGHWEVGVGAGN